MFSPCLLLHNSISSCFHRRWMYHQTVQSLWTLSAMTNSQSSVVKDVQIPGWITQISMKHCCKALTQEVWEEQRFATTQELHMCETNGFVENSSFMWIVPLGFMEVETHPTNLFHNNIWPYTIWWCRVWTQQQQTLSTQLLCTNKDDEQHTQACWCTWPSQNCLTLWATTLLSALNQTTLANTYCSAQTRNVQLN